MKVPAYAIVHAFFLPLNLILGILAVKSGSSSDDAFRMWTGCIQFFLAGCNATFLVFYIDESR